MLKLESRPVAENLNKNILKEVADLKDIKVFPKLSVIICTDDLSAISYAKSKEKAAHKLGIEIEIIDLGNECTNETLLSTIKKLNQDSSVHGILLEFPLNKNIDSDIALNNIASVKDVDGLGAVNLGLITMGKEDGAILPATPQSCIELAESFTELFGKNVAIIGRGKTVGKPLINMLINRNATVTVCHTKTKDIRETIKNCEVVFVAIGKAHAINRNHLHEGQIVIDAGINFIDNKLVGDVSPDAYELLKAYTPVPGGVGMLTSLIIFRNLLRSIKMQLNHIIRIRDMISINQTSVWEDTLSQFRDKIASVSPTPGGGSVVAVGATYGISLIIMAVEITLKGANASELEKGLFELRELSSKLSACADKDVEVFNNYMKAFKLPKEFEEEKVIRREAISIAVLEATNCPLETAQFIIDAMSVADKCIHHVKKNVISDVGAGIASLYGALVGVLFNVDINLPYINSQADKDYFWGKRNELKSLGKNFSKKIIAITEETLFIKD